MSTAEELRRADEASRQASRRDFSRPLVLEAGAGTGKTAALVARVLTWCLTAGWERSASTLAAGAAAGGGQRTVAESGIAAWTLDRVVAITFTDRAAAEMEERVAAALAQLAGGEPLLGLPLEELGLSEAALRQRALALLDALEHLQVGTIHAFCRRLLATHALAAGLHPAFIVDAEEREAQGVIDEVLEESLQALYGAPGDPAALELAEQGIGPGALSASLAALVRAGAPPEALGQALSAEPRQAFCCRLEQALDELLGLLGPALAAGAAGRLKLALQAQDVLTRLRAVLSQQDPLELLARAAAEEELAAASKQLREWAAGRLSKTVDRCLGEGVAALAAACQRTLPLLQHTQRQRPAVLAAAVQTLAPLLAEIYRRLRARGVQSFAGLLQDAHALLASSPALCAQVQRGIDQLLVDEFQDTDPTQCAIIRLLALPAAPSSHRPCLFLVGDPKQSIYGWRSADLGAYDRFVQEVLASGGARHALSVNFRSTPPILEEVERLVAPIMVSEQGVQPPFQRLVAHHEAQPPLSEGRCPVEHWIAWAPAGSSARSGPQTPADQARAIEAQAIARDLLAQHREQGLRWSRAAILLRTTSPLETYLGALKEAGIPFLVERDRSYYRRREVIDAAALLRAVIDPNDPIALVTVLRSLAIGVPDAALLPLWRQRLPELAARLGPASDALVAELERGIDQAVTELPADIPGLERVAGWDLALKSGLRRLAELRRSFAADRADLFVAKLRAATLGEELEAARYLGAHRLANLERFYRRLLQALAGGRGPQEILRELRLGVSGGLAEEEGSPGDEQLEAVRVLTIHKAKGLTFDQVYLVNLHGTAAGRDSGFVTAAVALEGRWELCLFGAPAPGFDLALARQQRIAVAEAVRTLYVAVTRARYRLVLTGCWGDGQQTIAVDQATCYADLLQHRRGARVALAALTPGQPVVGNDSVRWLLPRVELERMLPALELAVGTPVDLTEARRQAEVLAQARQQARLRMARPLVGPAASGAHQTPEDRWPHEPEELTAPDELAAPEQGERSPTAGGLARAVGSAIHRLLETLPLERPLQGAWARQLDQLPRVVRALQLPPTLQQAVVLKEARLLWQRLANGQLSQRLEALGEHVLGREVPLLLAGEETAGPVGAKVGAIDLLYRDPEDGALVVADYKTDRPRNEAELAQRIQVHQRQGEVYLEAVTRALPASPAPRFEVWFLWLDRRIPLSAG